MNLKEIISQLDLKVITESKPLEIEVTGGYTSDLLSDVIAHAQEGNLWITLQTHPNIVAVAKLKELAGVVIVHDRQPEQDTKRKAEEESITLLGTNENAFVISGRLYQLLTKIE